MLNEKFFELYKKAHLTLPRGTSFEPQLFGELIIKECAYIIGDAVAQGEPASTYVDKIKKHFGVEE
jgi:hypothetical protein